MAAKANGVVFNLLFLVACGALAVRGLWITSAAPRAIPKPQKPAYMAGEQVEFRGVDLSTSPQTLVLYLLKNCCKDQWSRFSTVSKELPTVVLTSGKTQFNLTLEDLVSANISARTVAVVTLDETKFLEVPTVLLVNSAGVIQAAWRGAVTEEQVSAIRTEIRKPK